MLDRVTIDIGEEKPDHRGDQRALVDYLLSNRSLLGDNARK